jgi:hypothetical protein
MSTTFPGGVDSYSTKVDNTTYVDAADVNNLQDAVVAIETALLTAPNPNSLDYLSKSRADTAAGVKRLRRWLPSKLASLFIVKSGPRVYTARHRERPMRSDSAKGREPKRTTPDDG